MAGPAHVAILMGTRDGARFLRAQLDTIAAQSHRDWRLFASDDGSTDATRAILAAFAPAVGPGGSRSARGRAAASPPTSSASPATRPSAPTTTPSPTRTTSGIPTGWRAGSRGSRRSTQACRRSPAGAPG